jgi:hypothetical protein
LANNNGVLPDSKLVVMHLCDNKLCVNPSHLTLATVAVNNLDAINKGIRLSIEEHVGIPILNELCRHGHPRTLENTTFRKKKDYSYALCRVCLRDRSREAKRNLSLEEKRQRMASWRAKRNTQHTTLSPSIPPIPIPPLTERAPGKMDLTDTIEPVN